MKSEFITAFKDNILGVNYSLNTANASELSQELKGNLTKLGINFEKYNSDLANGDRWDKAEMKKSAANPPKEIYEYQNFFLLERTDGKTVLVDGFRRLLWYKAPDMPVLYRLYSQKDLTDQKLLQLLVHLNHTKFFGGIGDYFDRGFALSFKVCFDLDILKFATAFKAYLQSDELSRGYSIDQIRGTEQNAEVISRILSPKFLDDMRFIQALVGKGVMLNSNFSALVWKTRKENPKVDFSADFFVRSCKENKHIAPLYEKFVKAGDTTSDASQKAINLLIELYSNIFLAMVGKEVPKSYLQLTEEANQLVAKIKKDKSLGCLTNNKDMRELEDKIMEFARNNGGHPPKIKMVLFPNKKVTRDGASIGEDGGSDFLATGVLNEDFHMTDIKSYDGYHANVALTMSDKLGNSVEKSHKGDSNYGHGRWNYAMVRYGGEERAFFRQDAVVFVCFEPDTTVKIETKGLVRYKRF